jgi:hypothetical protein
MNRDGKNIESVAAGIDWLTITAKGSDSRGRLFDESVRLKKVNEQLGYGAKPWTWKGYRGYMAGSLRWGTRDDSDIAILSGQDAFNNWFEFGQLAENCTRLDMAVTVSLKNPLLNVGGACYDWIEKNPDLIDKKRLYTLINNTAGGQTLYVGSRASDQFGRVYDKGIEAQYEDEPGKLWRFEIELKARRAKAVLDRLMEVEDRAWIPNSIQETVWWWFDTRDVAPLWNRFGDTHVIPLLVEAKMTDDECTLRWLSTQVRPGVGRLIKHGLIEQVFYALALSPESPWEHDGTGNILHVR